MLNIIKIFYNTILNNTKITLSVMIAFILILSFGISKFNIDASSDSLLLEDDKDLKLTKEISKNYKGNNFLVVVFSPKNGDLLDEQNINTIKNLSNDLKNIESVKSVTSILNVPILQNPKREIKDIVQNVITLESPNVDKELAKKEFLESPLYRENLVSEDFKTTALLVLLKENILPQTTDFAHKKSQKEQNHQNIVQIRSILEKYSDKGQLYLGGINMIADDIIGYVKSDLFVFGSILFIILTIVLKIIFKSNRWIFLPLMICIFSVVSSIGLLGYLGLAVTVVSSNFVSLQLIITMSIVLHLIVQYRESLQKFPNLSNKKIIIHTMISKLNPTFFAIITTIAGFSSLMYSGIKPIINLGWMMSAGIFVSMAISFTVFPVVLALLEKEDIKSNKMRDFGVINFCINTINYKPNFILISILISIVIFIFGAWHLRVENSFIDYFKEKTQIYQGMKTIDEKLGGTTPLEIILQFKEEQSSGQNDEFETEFENNKNDPQYWFTPSKMELVEKISDYLEKIEGVGKVQSLSMMLKIGKDLNDGKPLDTLTLALIYAKLPQEYKKVILDPYVSVENNQLRINARIIDSLPTLRRDELIKKIKKDLEEIGQKENVQINITGVAVLYNNMLQSLYASQILTLGFAAMVLFIVFLIIFKSFFVSLIAIGVNLLPIALLFGLMGILNIPLDIMTITIASIGVGIGVDDTIHYLHRYKKECIKTKNIQLSIENSHKSVGYGMFYTTLAIMCGFSILSFSNFIPTILFGLLTTMVMFVALLGALFALPLLLKIFNQDFR